MSEVNRYTSYCQILITLTLMEAFFAHLAKSSGFELAPNINLLTRLILLLGLGGHFACRRLLKTETFQVVLAHVGRAISCLVAGSLLSDSGSNRYIFFARRHVRLNFFFLATRPHRKEHRLKIVLRFEKDNAGRSFLNAAVYAS